MHKFKSPAKINLFLRVLGRRPDGFHDLASLFQAIDLHDILHFEESDEDTLSCTHASLSNVHDNLVWKAKELFKKKTGIKQCFSIHLEKNIPMEAGLGGGSSNAATTLWALNHLCGSPASDAELAQWGAEIGSDISFFLSSGTAYCTGRGEILRPLPGLPKQTVSIVKPSFGLSTDQVFKRFNLESRQTDHDIEEVLASFGSGQGTYFNDLEKPAFALKPELEAIKEQLIGLGFTTVLMSGAGSSFFCLGTGDLSSVPGCQAFQVNYINRETGSWYCL